MADLNPTAASLLGFLHHGPMTGWDLSQTAQILIGGFWSLTRSQVYRELSRMAEDGLVVAGPKAARDAVPYELTDEGRRAFAEWVARSPAEETIRFPMLLSVAFGAHQDRARLDAHLAAHRDLHRGRLVAYEATAAAAALAGEQADPWAAATLDFGLRYERMVLQWFEGLPDLLPPAPR